MELTKAKAIAHSLIEYLAPYCERIEIAGSIRREKPDQKDIELVAIPKMIPAPNGLFTGFDFPDEPAPTMSALTFAVMSPLGSVKKNGDRYKQILLPQDLYLDLFIVLPPAQWGALYTIRTGPGDFSHWLVTPKRQGGAMPAHLHQKDGALWNGNELVPTPEEKNFFATLGLEWLEPTKRVSPWRRAP